MKRIVPFTFQRGIRSGTVPAPLAIGLGAACKVCKDDMDFDSQHISWLSQRLYDKITDKLDGVIRNGDAVATYPGKSLLLQKYKIKKDGMSACLSFHYV